MLKGEWRRNSVCACAKPSAVGSMGTAGTYASCFLSSPRSTKICCCATSSNSRAQNTEEAGSCSRGAPGNCLVVMQYSWGYMSTVLWTPMRRSGIGERDLRLGFAEEAR